MNFLSNDNKELLWSILQENKLFENIRDEHFQKIKNIFENVIYNTNKKYPNKNLMEKNKITIEELIQNINIEKKRVPEPKIQMVYKAEDIKSERLNDFNIKLKQQQDDLYTTVNVSKPGNINFNDNTIDDDKPIGDEMDRLISERLASRERELEIPPISNEASVWINNGRDVSDKKKVTFNDNEIVNKPFNMNNDILKRENINNQNTKQTQSVSVDNVLNILKKKTADSENLKVINNEQFNMDIMENINKIKDDIRQMKLVQEKILDICSQLLETNLKTS